MKAAVQIRAQQFIGANLIITPLSLSPSTVLSSFIFHGNFLAVCVTYFAFHLHGKRTLASNVAGNRVNEWGDRTYRAYRRWEITWNVI